MNLIKDLVKGRKKHQFHGNSYSSVQAYFTSSPVQNLNESASGRKILLDNNEVKENNNDFKGYSIVDLNLLFQNIEN